tara:strand:- start:3747 stop:4409 length:663 start_codon:yes stop_codon:yes gene_type:complete
MEIRNLEDKKKWDYENGFYWFSSPSRLNKLLAHYELYKMIAKLPGDIFELGVYKATSLIRLATIRATLENDEARRIVGFDAFGKFPTNNLSLKSDIKFINTFEEEGGDGLNINETKKILEAKRFNNINLIEGNINETLPKYLADNPHTRLSILHLDMDVKEPTTFALEMLYEKVVSGGLIILDDYNQVAGATDAIDEFIKEKRLKLQKLPYYNIPSFIVK